MPSRLVQPLGILYLGCSFDLHPFYSMKIRNAVFLALAGALAAPAVAATFGTTDAPEMSTTILGETSTLKIGSTVPAGLELIDFEGQATNFKSLRGKTVLLHFWSDRCPAERHANPIFMKMEALYADNPDVVLLGIASNQNELGDKPARGADFSEHYSDLRTKRDEVGYKHTILADHGNVVSSMFQARSTPHCFVIDKEGVIRYSGALDDDPRGSKGDNATNYLVDAATALMKGEKLAVTETKPYG
ncbi:MAG: thiol-disulfide isomerase/thioredoxin [Planctomycetota bacterium]